MAIAVLYAAYDFFIAPRTKSAVIDIGKKSMELEAFINDITASMPKGSLSAADAYIVTRAEAQWTKDPFYDRKLFREWVKLKEPAKAGGGTSQKMSFIYSGYLTGKNNNVAIVNGVEYEAGNALEIEGYVLKKIYQNKVVIENIKSGSKFDVLLQE